MPIIPSYSTYTYSQQPVVATAVIQQRTDDSFYFPETNGHTGFAFNGIYYQDGVRGSPQTFASWYTEAGSPPFRGAMGQFPSYGLILFSRASLTILDESNPQLNLWMIFLFHDNLLLTDNFAIDNPNYPPPPMAGLQGFMPRGLAYANGIISAVFSPDPGSKSITSTMSINIDFTRDSAYLDVAI
jgi:hypothetical protein